jgi:hypothetical protein
LRFNSDATEGSTKTLASDDQAILAAYAAEVAGVATIPAITQSSADGLALKPGADSASKAPK